MAPMRHLLCLSLLLLPVAAAPDEKPAEDPRRLKPGDAPTPYTADEIRKACPEGRTDVFRVEDFGPVKLKTQKFGAGDEEGTTIEIAITKEDGTPLGSKTMTATWKELQSHASFPEKDTKITEETIEVPAGKFECWLYTLAQKDEEGETITTRAFFAKKLPGPPVKMTTETGGKTIFAMTLLEHKDPATAEERKPDEKAEPSEDEKPADG